MIMITPLVISLGLGTLLAGVAAGGTGLLGSIFGARSSHAENKYSYEQQKELQQMQQDYNTMMFNKTNAYNTPSAQLSRLQAAGLNPNNYGDVATATQPATPAVPSVGHPESVGDKIAQGFGSLSAISDALLKKAQVDNIEANTAKTNAEADIARVEAGERPHVIAMSLEESKTRIASNLANVDLSKTQKSKLEFEVTKVLPEVISKSVAERERLAQEIQKGIVEIANLVRSGALLEQKISTEQATRWQIFEQIKGSKFDNTVRELKARIAEQYGIDYDSDAFGLLVELMLSDDANQTQLFERLTNSLAGIISSVPKAAVSGTYHGLKDLYHEIFNSSVSNPISDGTLNNLPKLR